MATPDSGKGQVDDGLRGVAHEPKLLGRRHASPRLDLALLERRGRVAGERSRPARGVSDRHPAIIGSLRVEMQRSAPLSAHSYRESRRGRVPLLQ